MGVSEMGSGLHRWVVRWGSVVCRDGGSVVSIDGFCDGKGMGCAVEVVVNLMGCAMECVCKMREFSMGWGLISDEVGFDFRWGVSEREGGFRWVVYDMG
ncbi:unnamed protein product [Prunus armeniaca]